MNTREYISEKIRELRKSRSWTQSELGAMLYPSKKGATISSWEQGRTTPDPDDMISLCEVFGIEISDFYPQNMENESAKRLSFDERELLDLYRNLPQNGKRAVISGLKVFDGRQ